MHVARKGRWTSREHPTIMKAILKAKALILVPETAEETQSLAAWKASVMGHVFHVANDTGTGLFLRDLGRHEEACNEPINVSSRSVDPMAQLLSNFAPTPFDLDGRRYQSVESFWQGLKFDDAAERRRIASLDGAAARRAGEQKGYGSSIVYESHTITVGTWTHWELMERACWAKFTQNEDAKEALLATGSRPLTHQMRRDSHTIPGAIMAEIWMRIRRRLRTTQAMGDLGGSCADGRGDEPVS
jgi:predicted NAD-dependent protein-ADP-ribosyltransferase YbiA (DUF1768 family)